MKPQLHNLFTLLAFFNAAFYSTATQYDCSRIHYERCVNMADPLVKEVQFIFPDNVNDIDLVCRTWNNFVDCLKKYTERCFSNQQRHQFNKAVEVPIASVHQMCTQPHYQKEYLRYAPCMKSTVVKNGQCERHYNLLVDQVNQGDVISKSTLCCSHYRFKQCVFQEIRQVCDRGAANGPAVIFSTQIFDKAFSFLQDQCYNYIPNPGDCSQGSHFRSDTHTDNVMISTSPSEVYRWGNAASKEVPTSKPTPAHIVTTSWLPSSSDTSEASSSSTFAQYETTSSPVPVPALGSRSRPASYGRASGWFNQGGNTVKPDLASSRASGATISSWTVVNPSSLNEHEAQSSLNTDSPLSSSTTWYPAAGSQLSNEVDEPNQMGLIKPDSSANFVQNNILIWISLYVLSRLFYY